MVDNVETPAPQEPNEARAVFLQQASFCGGCALRGTELASGDVCPRTLFDVLDTIDKSLPEADEARLEGLVMACVGRVRMGEAPIDGIVTFESVGALEKAAEVPQPVHMRIPEAE